MSYHPDGRYPLPAKGWRSGFCNPSNPADSHARCHGVNGKGSPCSCACHTTIEKEAMTETITTRTGRRDDAFEPGLVYGVSDETYHADPVPGGSLSSSFARLLTEHVPAKAEARRRNRRPTKAMNLGKAVHAHALGAGPVLMVWEHDGRTKEGKDERADAAPLIAREAIVVVTENERDQIHGMIDALHKHPEVLDILTDSVAEVSGFWQEGDTWCRARYDLLGDAVAWDYKTAQDVTRRGFSKSLGAYGYHQQAEFYQRGLRALGHEAGRAPMRFICQETEAPYLVQIHTCDDGAMWAASELNDRAIRVYAEAKRTGIWPGYDDLFAEPTSLPAWYFADHEAVLELEVV